MTALDCRMYRQACTVIICFCFMQFPGSVLKEQAACPSCLQQIRSRAIQRKRGWASLVFLLWGWIGTITWGYTFKIVLMSSDVIGSLCPGELKRIDDICYCYIKKCLIPFISPIAFVIKTFTYDAFLGLGRSILLHDILSHKFLEIKKYHTTCAADMHSKK